MNKTTRRSYRTPEEAFAARTERQGECLVWTGTTAGSGYGVFRAGGRLQRVHRWAWEQHFGPIPDGKILDHTCWNRACCNVEHLRIADDKLNNENRSGSNKNSKSGVRGVHWHARDKHWVVTAKHQRKTYHGGCFDSLAEAEQAAIDLRNRLFTYNNADRAA